MSTSHSSNHLLLITDHSLNEGLTAISNKKTQTINDKLSLCLKIMMQL